MKKKKKRNQGEYLISGGYKMPVLKFYDVKGKKSFTTDKYRIVKKGGRKFAVAKAPSGIEAWRVMGVV